MFGFNHYAPAKFKPNKSMETCRIKGPMSPPEFKAVKESRFSFSSYVASALILSAIRWKSYGADPYLDGLPLASPFTVSTNSTNMASGIYIFLSLDNDNKGADWQNNPWMVQYVRVWRLDPSNRRSDLAVPATAAGRHP